MAQLEAYRAHHPRVRWTEPGSWHLTLLFLGAVAPEHVPDLVALVDGVAAGAAPYRVRVAAGGGRLGPRDGVGWLSLAEGASRLVELAAELARGCPADITLAGPPRPTPLAHLTVVRRADQAVIEALGEQRHGPLEDGWQVGSINLVRSHLGREGARYETLHEAAL